MLLAVLATVFSNDIASWEWILVGVIIGSGIGAYSARKVQMTSMPQLVAIFNGLGGATSAVVAAGELIRLIDLDELIPQDVSITIMASVIVGGATLTGSLIAYGKLQGVVPTRPLLLPIRHVINTVLLLGMIGSTAVSYTHLPLPTIYSV